MSLARTLRPGRALRSLRAALPVIHTGCRTSSASTPSGPHLDFRGSPVLSSGVVMARHPPQLPHQLSFAEVFSTSTIDESRNEDISEDCESLQTVESLVSAADAAMGFMERWSNSAAADRAVREFCDEYEAAKVNKAELGAFFRALSSRSVDRDAVAEAAAEYAAASHADRIKMEDRLRSGLVPRYLWLFRRVGQIEGGVKFLVDLRADLVLAQRAESDAAALAELRSMNAQLKQLLSLWFSVGFLKLERVTWQSPCALLQKVSDYEAVHPVRNWTDLKSRVGAYRRCFVYTHRSMPGEPIVVLHVALAEQVPARIADVVRHHRMLKRFSTVSDTVSHNEIRAGEDASLCRAAIFYSITSTQTGLVGIELGTHLIKQAVNSLREELPGLEHFSTLSPIPNFRPWLLGLLQAAARQEEGSEDVLTQPETKNLATVLQCPESEVSENLAGLIRSNSWADDERLTEALEAPLMRLCARYLYRERHRGLALCQVANFHLRNGAVLWRINWRGDLSARGMSNSCGIMVNYKYFLKDLEENSARYQEDRTIRTGELVDKLIDCDEIK